MEDNKNMEMSYSSLFDEGGPDHEMLKQLEQERAPLPDDEVERIARTLWGKGIVEDEEISR